jgi:hypothetical protein
VKTTFFSYLSGSRPAGTPLWKSDRSHLALLWCWVLAGNLSLPVLVEPELGSAGTGEALSPCESSRWDAPTANSGCKTVAGAEGTGLRELGRALCLRGGDSRHCAGPSWAGRTVWSPLPGSCGLGARPESPAGAMLGRDAKVCGLLNQQGSNKKETQKGRRMMVPEAGRGVVGKGHKVSHRTIAQQQTQQ